jgi:tetratricopeptide (TPR) repeat protein
VPQIFFGRDPELAQIIHMITASIGSRPARIAILGPGGYGKTTLAHAVLTVDIIREHFGDSRYFVPCESVTSSGALLTELGKTLGVVKGGSDNLWSRIQAALSSKDSIICFDNFESAWDQQVETKHSVEELLSRVTELPHLTVLLTMRGAERPARTHWTQPFLEPLETLGHDAAKEIWQAISENYDDFSEKLIEAVDYVPLAVDLLSHLSQVTLPELLWEEWNSKWTKAIQTGQEHRLSNLEYSIQLSVNSGRMKANPSAKNMLGVLSMLPDGLHVKQLGKFKGMLVDLDVTLCLQTLLQCSLIKLTTKRYQPHPIVRHFCLNQGMLLLKHKAIIEKFYITLALSDYYGASSEAYGELVLEFNNTKATLLGLLNSNYGDESKLISASIQFTEFCINIGDHSDKIISQAVELVQKNSGATALLIRGLNAWGRLYFYAYNLERAQEKMQEAERLCLSSLNVNSQLYGCVLEGLGDIYMLQDALNDAKACYKKGLGLHKDSNNIYRQGDLNSKLGTLCRRLKKLDEAVILYQSAIQQHHDIPLSQGNDYLGLGWTYLLQNKLIEAEAAVQEAFKSHKAVNATLSQANDCQLLATVYLKLERLEDAMAVCQMALESNNLTNNTLGQGNVHMILGGIYISQGKMDESEKSFQKALELHTVAKDGLGMGGDSFWLGYICMRKGQLEDAKGMFEKAMALHRKAQASAEEEQDVMYLTAVMTQMKQGSIE